MSAQAPSSLTALLKKYHRPADIIRGIGAMIIAEGGAAAAHFYRVCSTDDGVFMSMMDLMIETDTFRLPSDMECLPGSSLSAHCLDAINRNAVMERTAFLPTGDLSRYGMVAQQAFLLPVDGVEPVTAVISWTDGEQQHSSGGEIRTLLRVCAGFLRTLLNAEAHDRRHIFIRDIRKYASHDLRGLTAVITELASLQVDTVVSDPEESRTIAHRVHANSRAVTEAVNKLLLPASLLSSGMSECPVELHRVLPSMLRDDLSVMLSRNGTAVHVDPLPVVLGDETALMKVFHEIVKNSLEHGADNIFIGFDQLSRELFVKDNGAQVTHETVRDMFTAGFSRDRQNSSRRTGLGLFIVKHLLAMHRASIRAAANENAPGIVQTITLPRGMIVHRGK